MLRSTVSAGTKDSRKRVGWLEGTVSAGVWSSQPPGSAIVGAFIVRHDGDVPQPHAQHVDHDRVARFVDARDKRV